MKGNKGTLAKFWEQGNKIRKVTVRKHAENVWEHGNIGQFWKGTREQGPPWETLTDRGTNIKLGKEVMSIIGSRYSAPVSGLEPNMLIICSFLR